MAATMIAKTSSFMGVKPVQAKQPKAVSCRAAMVVRAGAYDEELIATAVRLIFYTILHSVAVLHWASLWGEETPGICNLCD